MRRIGIHGAGMIPLSSLVNGAVGGIDMPSGFTHRFISTNIVGLNDGDGIATWPDVNGNDATQGVGASQPTYKESIVGALPVARFDGGDSMSAPNDTPAGRRTYLFVIITSDVGSNTIFDHGGSNIGQFVLNFTNRPLTFLGPNNFRFWNDVPSQDDGAIHIWEVYIAGSAQADINSGELYLDGAIQTVNSTTATGAISAWGNLIIGGSVNPFTGDMAEFVIYNKKLSTAERLQYVTYAQTIWGTP